MDIKNRKSISQSASYFDDYQRGNYWNEIAKNYQSVLFKGGKPLQSRELNFLQSILHNRLKTMGDSLYKNGSVVNGCAVTYNDDSGEKTISITDGVIYWDGTFFEISANSKTLNDNIESFDLLYVYLYPDYEIITSQNDTELNDPAIKYKVDESVSGADRLKVTFEIIESVNEEKEYYTKEGKKEPLPVQRFLIAVIDKNGEVSLTNRNFKLDEKEINGITEVVEGLKIRNNKTYYEVESGNGTIKGDEVVFDGYKRIDIDELRNKHNIVIDDESLMLNSEEKWLDVRDNPLSGSIWCDVSYTQDNEVYFDGMLMPGETIEIFARIGGDESDPIENNNLIKLGEADIAEAYILGNRTVFQNIIIEPPHIGNITPATEITPISIDIDNSNDLNGSIINPTTGLFEPIVLEQTNYKTSTSNNVVGNSTVGGNGNG